MDRLLLVLVIAYCLTASGCTPLGAVSMIGSTISRTVEIEQNKKEREPVNRRVAYTNVNLGVEYMRQGDYEKALSKFNRAIDADDKYAVAYNMLGVLYQLLEEPEQAEDNFNKALKLEPEDPSALNNYGQFLCKQEREAEAEEKFLAAAANPFYSTPELAYTNAGSCAYLHKNVERAEQYFQKSLQVNPQMPVALSQMAEITFDKGQYTTARDYLERYLEVASHTPKTLWLGIRIERQFNDLDRLASYTLLLRNKYPDTVEAELLRISEDYKKTSNASTAQKNTVMISKQKSEPARQVPISRTAITDSRGLLGEVDLSYFPQYLEEKDLLELD